MADTINFKFEISPDNHKNGSYNVTVNNKCYSRSDDYTASLHRAVTSLLTVAGIYNEKDMPANIAKDVNDLEFTVDMMLSYDHEDRFRAEYQQVRIRRDKLKSMLRKWDEGTLNFTPKSPRAAYEMQLASMSNYVDALEIRASIEGILLK